MSEGAGQLRASIQARRQRYQTRQREMGAAGSIQRRARMLAARAEIQRCRQLRDDKDARTKSLLTRAGSSLDRLRTLVRRQRVLRDVLTSLYAEVLAAEYLPVAHTPNALLSAATGTLAEGTGPRDAAVAVSALDFAPAPAGHAPTPAPAGHAPAPSAMVEAVASDGSAEGTGAGGGHTTPLLHAASTAALDEASGGLATVRKLSEAVAIAEAQQRVLGVEIAGNAGRQLASLVAEVEGNEDAGKGAYSANWSGAVERASTQALVAHDVAMRADVGLLPGVSGSFSVGRRSSSSSIGGASSPGAPASVRAGKHANTELQGCIQPHAIAASTHPISGQVDVLALLTTGRAARAQALLACARFDVEAKAWSVTASTAQMGGSGTAAEAEQSLEQARRKAREAAAKLREARQALQTYHAERRDQGRLRFGTDFGATVAPAHDDDGLGLVGAPAMAPA